MATNLPSNGGGMSSISGGELSPHGPQGCRAHGPQPLNLQVAPREPTCATESLRAARKTACSHRLKQVEVREQGPATQQRGHATSYNNLQRKKVRMCVCVCVCARAQLFSRV